jgi:hypothetical protein
MKTKYELLNSRAPTLEQLEKYKEEVLEEERKRIITDILGLNIQSTQFAIIRAIVNDKGGKE